MSYISHALTVLSEIIDVGFSLYLESKTSNHYIFFSHKNTDLKIRISLPILIVGISISFLFHSV